MFGLTASESKLTHDIIEEEIPLPTYLFQAIEHVYEPTHCTLFAGGFISSWFPHVDGLCQWGIKVCPVNICLFQLPTVVCHESCDYAYCREFGRQGEGFIVIDTLLPKTLCNKPDLIAHNFAG